MKSARINTLKRDINLVSRGLRNGSKTLFRWVNTPGDKEKTKKRTLVVLSVPAGMLLVGAEYPGPVLAAGLLTLLGASLWFAHTEKQVLILDSTDFLPPFDIEGRIMDFPEVLTYIARQHPSADLQELISALHGLGGPRFTEDQMTYQLRRLGVRHGAFPPEALELEEETQKEAEKGTTSVSASPEASPGASEASPPGALDEAPEEEEGERKPLFTETAPSPSPTPERQRSKQEEAGQRGESGSSLMEKARGRVQGMFG